MDHTPSPRRGVDRSGGNPATPLESLDWLQRRAARARTLISTHPRALAAGVSAALLGFAATAFGIAPLAPDAAELPRQVITETVEALPLAPQLEALADHSLELSRTEITRTSDTADSLLRRLGVADPQAASFLARDPTARRVLQGRPGKLVTARARGDGTLVELVARFPSETRELYGTHFTRLTVTPDGDGWRAQAELAPLQAQVRMGSGTIQSTLFAATDAAGVPDPVAMQLAEIFSTDIDFHRELRRGDTFSVVYETLTADGEPIVWNQGTGRVLASEFVNDGRTHQAVWYQGRDGRGAYYDLSGQSKRRTFLASPLEFSRVTSGFAMRMHPILQRMRAHKGVDYAAPTGTPVRVVGDGVVEFAGWQNGYGNVVVVAHSNHRKTLYAHLSRIDVRQGERLAQGQHVGAVGATGWATGPHLHFEFIAGGVQQDPLLIAKASEAVSLAPTEKPLFEQFAQTAKLKLEVARSVTTASLGRD
jgi:murein DD-endopeptidase MepM/ murein hydrolase activator NlpD